MLPAVLFIALPADFVAAPPADVMLPAALIIAPPAVLFTTFFKLPLNQIHCHKVAVNELSFQKILYDKLKNLEIEYMKHTILSIMGV